MLEIEEVWKHPLTKRFQELGFPLAEFAFDKGDGSNKIVGLQLLTENTQIVYAFDKPDTIRIVMYKRLNTRVGLHNAFRDFIWFLHVVVEPETGIVAAIGVVNPIEGVDDDRLSRNRIAKVYQYFNANVIGQEAGGLVVFGEREPFIKSQKRWPRQPKPGTIPSADESQSPNSASKNPS